MYSLAAGRRDAPGRPAVVPTSAGGGSSLTVAALRILLQPGAPVVLDLYGRQVSGVLLSEFDREQKFVVRTTGLHCPPLPRPSAAAQAANLPHAALPSEVAPSKVMTFPLATAVGLGGWPSCTSGSAPDGGPGEAGDDSGIARALQDLVSGSAHAWTPLWSSSVVLTRAGAAPVAVSGPGSPQRPARSPSVGHTATASVVLTPLSGGGTSIHEATPQSAASHAPSPLDPFGSVELPRHAQLEPSAADLASSSAHLLGARVVAETQNMHVWASWAVLVQALVALSGSGRPGASELPLSQQQVLAAVYGSRAAASHCAASAQSAGMSGSALKGDDELVPLAHLLQRRLLGQALVPLGKLRQPQVQWVTASLNVLLEDQVRNGSDSPALPSSLFGRYIAGFLKAALAHQEVALHVVRRASSDASVAPLVRAMPVNVQRASMAALQPSEWSSLASVVLQQKPNPRSCASACQLVSTTPLTLSISTLEVLALLVPRAFTAPAACLPPSHKQRAACRLAAVLERCPEFVQGSPNDRRCRSVLQLCSAVEPMAAAVHSRVALELQQCAASGHARVLTLPDPPETQVSSVPTHGAPRARAQAVELVVRGVALRTSRQGRPSLPRQRRRAEVAGNESVDDMVARLLATSHDGLSWAEGGGAHAAEQRHTAAISQRMPERPQASMAQSRPAAVPSRERVAPRVLEAFVLGLEGQESLLGPAMGEAQWLLGQCSGQALTTERGGYVGRLEATPCPESLETALREVLAAEDLPRHLTQPGAHRFGFFPAAVRVQANRAPPLAALPNLATDSKEEEAEGGAAAEGDLSRRALPRGLLPSESKSSQPEEGVSGRAIHTVAVSRDDAGGHGEQALEQVGDGEAGVWDSASWFFGPARGRLPSAVPAAGKHAFSGALTVLADAVNPVPAPDTPGTDLQPGALWLPTAATLDGARAALSPTTALLLRCVVAMNDATRAARAALTDVLAPMAVASSDGLVESAQLPSTVPQATIVEGTLRKVESMAVHMVAATATARLSAQGVADVGGGESMPALPAQVSAVHTHTEAPAPSGLPIEQATPGPPTAVDFTPVKAPGVSVVDSHMRQQGQPGGALGVQAVHGGPSCQTGLWAPQSRPTCVPVQETVVTRALSELQAVLVSLFGRAVAGGLANRLGFLTRAAVHVLDNAAAGLTADLAPSPAVAQARRRTPLSMARSCPVVSLALWEGHFEPSAVRSALTSAVSAVVAAESTAGQSLTTGGTTGVGGVVLDVEGGDAFVDATTAVNVLVGDMPHEDVLSLLQRVQRANALIAMCMPLLPWHSSDSGISTLVSTQRVHVRPWALHSSSSGDQDGQGSLMTRVRQVLCSDLRQRMWARVLRLSRTPAKTASRSAWAARLLTAHGDGAALSIARSIGSDHTVWAGVSQRAAELESAHSLALAAVCQAATASLTQEALAGSVGAAAAHDCMQHCQVVDTQRSALGPEVWGAGGMWAAAGGGAGILSGHGTPPVRGCLVREDDSGEDEGAMDRHIPSFLLSEVGASGEGATCTVFLNRWSNSPEAEGEEGGSQAPSSPTRSEATATSSTGWAPELQPQPSPRADAGTPPAAASSGAGGGSPPLPATLVPTPAHPGPCPRSLLSKECMRTIFLQMLQQLHPASPGTRGVDPVRLRQSRRPWRVDFIGEGGQDVGGLFNEALSACVDEVMDPATLPLFTPSVNAAGNTGTHRDCLVPVPGLLAEGQAGAPPVVSRLAVRCLEFLGMLMGVAVRVGFPLPLRLPPLIWRLLLGQPVTLGDVASVDASSAAVIAGTVKACDMSGPLDVSLALGGGQGGAREHLHVTWTLPSSGAHLPPLLLRSPPAAAAEGVLMQDAQAWVGRALCAKAAEFAPAVDCIRRGLGQVLPLSSLHMWDIQAFEREVCGQATLDVALLKRNTQYEGYTADAPAVQHFWTALEGMSAEEQCSVLRFVWARERLPPSDAAFTQPFILARFYRDTPDASLPQAHSCSFQLDLPEYSSPQVLRRQLLLAAVSCIGYDLDGGARGVAEG